MLCTYNLNMELNHDNFFHRQAALIGFMRLPIV